METKQVDTVVLGAGTAGLVARRTAEKAGASTLMIDPGPWGTTCARVGCMPSKLLIAAADAAYHAAHASMFGVEASVTIDGAKVMERVRRERDRFVGFVLDSTQALHDAGKLIKGRGRFVEPHLIQVDEALQVQAKTVVIATGSRPIVPPPYRHLSAKRMLFNDDLFELPDLPESVLVVGPGVIGLELGQALSRLGVRVTIVGVQGALGPLSDRKMLEVAHQIFQQELDLHTDFQLESIAEDDDGVHVKLTGQDGKPRDERFAYVLMTAGRRPNLDKIGLEHTGVALDQKGMPTWDACTTQIESTHIFVAGDANNHLPLLHEAADEGRIAGENAANYPNVLSFHRSTPLSVVFSDPQIGIVGNPWRAMNCDNHRVGEVDYGDQGRARVMGQNKGLVRVYGEKRSGLLVGAEMLGPRVEHTAHLLAWAIQKRMTVSELLEMPFYHPVIEEGIRTALRDLQHQLRIARPAAAPCEEFGPGG